MPSSACSSPPDIYTLSLHDALPICASVVNLLLEFSEKSPEIRTNKKTARQNRLLGAWPSAGTVGVRRRGAVSVELHVGPAFLDERLDRKSTRLNSSHTVISYAVFCLLLAPRHLHSFPTRRSSDLCLCG